MDLRSLNQNGVIGEIEKLLGLNAAKGFERDVLVRSIACRTLGAFMPTDYVGSIFTHHFTDIRFTVSLAEAQRVMDAVKRQQLNRHVPRIIKMINDELVEPKLFTHEKHLDAWDVEGWRRAGIIIAQSGTANHRGLGMNIKI